MREDVQEGRKDRSSDKEILNDKGHPEGCPDAGKDLTMNNKQRGAVIKWIEK